MVAKAIIPAGFTQRKNGLIAPDGVMEPRHKQFKSALAFDAAETNRWTDRWFAPNISPITLISQAMPKMRDRIRSLARNAPWLVALIRVWVDNVVGAGNGWKLQAKSFDDEFGDELNDDRNKRIELNWNRWIRGVDINNRESLEMFLRLCEAEYAEVGEYFIMLRTANDGRRVPLALDLIPSERLDATFEKPAGMDPLTRKKTGRVSNGIEFDTDGRRVAYHFDSLDQFGNPNAMLPKLRIPAKRVLHRYLKTRAGQERGIPPLYAAILLLRDFDDAIDFEMQGWETQARMLGAIKHQNSGVIPVDQERDATDNRPIHRIDGVSLLDLGVDEDLVFPAATRPNKDITSFTTFITRTLGKTAGFSYEATSGDYSNVNFASGRLGGLADRRTAKRNQAELDHLNLLPIYEEFIFLLVSDGKIGVSLSDFIDDPDRFNEHTFIYPGWEHHDPAKEVTAAALRILVGLSTLADESAALGKDWEANLTQIAREIKRMEELGIPRVSVGNASELTGRGNEGFSADGSQGDGQDNSGDGNTNSRASIAQILSPPCLGVAS